jgi:alkylated DNA repair dioxygenase AlkB
LYCVWAPALPCPACLLQSKPYPLLPTSSTQPFLTLTAHNPHNSNEYTPATSLSISAHVESFRFGEPVCALTLGDGDSMRFHELSAPHDGSVRSGRAREAQRTGRRVDVWLPARSLLILRGEARESWMHEIVGRRRGKGRGWRRVSLTFRVGKFR